MTVKKCMYLMEFFNNFHSGRHNFIQNFQKLALYAIIKANTIPNLSVINIFFLSKTTVKIKENIRNDCLKTLEI